MIGCRCYRPRCYRSAHIGVVGASCRALLRLGLAVSLAMAVPASSWGWVILTSENYETGTATGWSDNTVTDSTHTDFTKFLGRFDKNSGTVDKTFTGLPGGSSLVKMEFDFYRLDSWDGEYFRVYVDDTQVADDWFKHNSDSSPPNATALDTRANRVFEGWSDQRFRYTFTTTGTDTDIKLGFSSTLNSTMGDESWGIDNVVISYLVSSGDRTWNSAGTADWTSVANWDDGPPPVSGTLAATKPTSTENAFVPAGQVNVTTVEDAFGLDIGSTLPTGNPIVDVNSAGSLTVAAGTSIGSTGTLNVNGSLTTGSINSVVGSVVNLNNGGSLTTSGGTIDRLIASGTATLDGSGVTITNLTMNDQLIGTSDFTATNTVLNASSTFNQTAGTATVGNISETAASGITKDGAGLLRLPTNNTYTGQTDIVAGRLQIETNDGLGTSAGDTIVQSGAQLRLSGGGLTTGETITINGTGPGNDGALYVQNGGVKTISAVANW